MTIEMGNSGVSGYGYSTEESKSAAGAMHSDAWKSPSTVDDENPQAVSSDNQTSNKTNQFLIEEIAVDRQNEIPGFEGSASICLNRAREIARSLEHLSLTADHLMLALTMDQGARRLLERVGDVSQLRETAMKRLGRQGSA